MNSIKSGNSIYNYHIITNAEFTGVLDKYYIYRYYTPVFGAHETETYVSNIYDYHLFIKYGDKV